MVLFIISTDLILLLWNIAGEEWYIVIVYCFYPALGLIWGILNSILRLIILSPIGEELLLRDDRIKSKYYDTSLQITPTLSVGFFSLNRLRRKITWGYNIDGISIRDLNEESHFLRISPVSNFEMNYFLLFYYILDWKNENGFLFSKEEICSYSSLFG